MFSLLTTVSQEQIENVYKFNKVVEYVCFLKWYNMNFKDLLCQEC